MERRLAENAENVFFFEESIRTGSVGESFASRLEENRVSVNFRHIAVNDEFIKQAPVSSQLKKYRLDAQGVLEVVKSEQKKET